MKYGVNGLVWFSGFVLALVFVVPFAAEWAHMTFPVFGDVQQQNVDRKGNVVFFSGLVEKTGYCEVDRSSEVFARMEWEDQFGKHYRFARLQYPSTGDPLNAREQSFYRKGDIVPIGPYFIEMPSDVAEFADTLVIEISCRRWNFFDVEADMGPFDIPAPVTITTPTPSDDFIKRQKQLETLE